MCLVKYPEFIKNLCIAIFACRKFSNDFSADKENEIIINQEVVRIFDLGSLVEAIGKMLIGNHA